MKRVVGDLLSLVFGMGEDDYEPTKGEYFFFVGVVLMMIVMVVLRFEN